MNRLSTLRFWCQKVLPLVYDDSLSYYELLNKVVKYLNSTIEDVQSLIAEMEHYQIAINVFNGLLPTGTKANRKSEIEALLAKGTCYLAPGDYYVSGINMPINSALIGSGVSTRLILLDSVSSGACVNINTRNCVVKNMKIDGYGDGVYTQPTSIGNRNGIVIKGEYSSDGRVAGGNIIECLHIVDFSGAALLLDDTSINVNDSNLITDCKIERSGAGVYIKRYSEYNRIENTIANTCYRGCINNAGNNNFSNCAFTQNDLNLLMEDDPVYPDSNIGHGSYVGCTFNHSNGTEHKSIDLKGVYTGTQFSACQNFFGSINIDDSTGIMFDSCNFGRETPINVTDSTTVLFDGCLVHSIVQTPVTQSGNTSLIFVNCYSRTGAQFTPLN